MEKTSLIFLFTFFTLNCLAAPHTDSKIKKAACIPLKLGVAAACLIALDIGGAICIDYNRDKLGMIPSNPVTFNEKLGRLIYSEYGSTARLLSLWSVFPLVAGVIGPVNSIAQDLDDLIFG